jgi:hypothetical protein
MAHGNRHSPADPAGTSLLKINSFARRRADMHPFRKLREAGPPTPEQAAAIFAENVVMHSPVLVKPIIGRELVAITISNSSHSRDNPGQYIFEAKVNDRTTLLRWQGAVEGHKIESLELWTDDQNGLLIERSVAYRPFPALRIFRDRLIALNAGKLPADMWDYQT